MYFLNEDHKSNFQLCIDKFEVQNREYCSCCYIASVPEIFKCFSLQEQIHGPFDWFFETLDDNLAVSERKGVTAPLTNQTTALIHLALNLWNGHPFDLSVGISSWDDDLFKVALQAIALRRNLNQSINLSQNFASV